MNTEKIFYNFYDNYIWPYISTRLYISKFDIPIDISIFRGQEFKNIVNKRVRLLEADNRNIDGCIEDLEILINKIEKEIIKLKE